LPGSQNAPQPARQAPGARPLLGHLPAYRRDRLAFFESCANGSDSVTACRLGGRGYVLNDPQDIKHVLVANEGNYDKARYIASPWARWNRQTLLTSSATVHRRKRRMMQPLFRRPLVEMLGARSRPNAERLVAGWYPGDEIEVTQAMMALAQRNILETLFDSPSEELVRAMAQGAAARRRFVQHFHFSAVPLPEYLPLKVNFDHLRARRRVYVAVDGEIAARRSMTDPPQDLLTMLFEARSEDGAGMTDSDVRDEVITFSMTGFETVGETLAWTLFLLARHPDVDATVAEEVHASFDPDEPAADLGNRLPYCKAVLQETLRLYPPTWIYARVAIGADELPSGPRIEPGSKLYFCPYAVHRSARFWDEPERFDPERFRNGSLRASERYAYFPFSGGARVCIGEQLAMAEMLTVLATIVERHRLTIPADREVAPAPNLTLTPRGGLRMRVEPRD
jgi:cytochrome P450